MDIEIPYQPVRVTHWSSTIGDALSWIGTHALGWVVLALVAAAVYAAARARSTTPVIAAVAAVTVTVGVTFTFAVLCRATGSATGGQQPYPWSTGHPATVYVVDQQAFDVAIHDELYRRYNLSSGSFVRTCQLAQKGTSGHVHGDPKIAHLEVLCGGVTASPARP